MENRLVGTTSPASALSYDPLGQLSQFLPIPANPTQFLYDGDALVAEYTVSANTATLTRRYVHGDRVDEPWVQYNGASVGPQSRRYLHADHQGSIVAHSDYQGGAQGKLSYDAFGIPRGANFDRFQYTGQAYLREIGLFHYKARMYAPKLGRFLQTDPIFYADDMNLYAYVGNDPLSKRDPTGRSCEPITNDQGKVTGVASCKIDVDRDKLVKKYGEAAVGKLENSYTNAVNKMIQAPKYASTTLSIPRVDGKGHASATASAAGVASSLINRQVRYDPRETRAMSTNADGTRGSVGDKAFDTGGTLQGRFRNPEAAQTKAWVHEGIHTPEVHGQLGPDPQWYPNHTQPFQDAAQDLLEKSQ